MNTFNKHFFVRIPAPAKLFKHTGFSFFKVWQVFFCLSRHIRKKRKESPVIINDLVHTGDSAAGAEVTIKMPVIDN